MFLELFQNLAKFESENFPIERFRTCPFLLCRPQLTTKPPELHVLACECQLLAGILPFHHGETISNFLLDATVGKIQRQRSFCSSTDRSHDTCNDPNIF